MVLVVLVHDVPGWCTGFGFASNPGLVVLEFWWVVLDFVFLC